MSNVRRRTPMNFRDPNSRRWPSPLFRRMSRIPGSIVRGFQSRAGDPRLTGRLRVRGRYCGCGQRSRCEPAGIRTALACGPDPDQGLTPFPSPPVRAFGSAAVLPVDPHCRISWQEWQGSNLRPPVLETGALPIELHSYGPSRHRADQGRFQAQGAAGLQDRIARVRRAGFACLCNAFWATVRPRQ